MTHSKSRVIPGSSRLVNELSRLLPVEQKTTHESFAQILSHKIDFSGSVKLSDAHGEVRMIKRRVEAGVYRGSDGAELNDEEVFEQCQQSFVRVRKSLVQSINQSFIEGSQSRAAFPPFPEALIAPAKVSDVAQDPETEQKSGTEQEYSETELDEGEWKKLREALVKFYRLHQSDMSAKVQGLKGHIRELLNGRYPDLDELIKLDQALDEVLSSVAKRSLLRMTDLIKRMIDRLMMGPESDNHDMFAGHDLIS